MKWHIKRYIKGWYIYVVPPRWIFLRNPTRLFMGRVRTNSHMISCAWRFFPRYKKKGWKILLVMFMQNFPDDKWSACFMFHLKTKNSNDLSSDSADPAFISPEKKSKVIFLRSQFLILPPRANILPASRRLLFPLLHAATKEIGDVCTQASKYRVEMSFKPPTWLSFMHTTSSPSFSSGTMEQIACFWRSVDGERVKLYAASTKGKRG